MPRPQATPRACTSQETTSIPKGDTGMKVIAIVAYMWVSLGLTYYTVHIVKSMHKGGE